jgi:iron complex transport system ATP-binding protein
MSAPGKKILLETKDLAVGYSTTQAPLFENLNLQLCEGELICFMGPNGVGKSTLIRTLAGLQKATRGAIRTDTTTDLQFPIAVVLTDKVSTPGMSVYESSRRPSSRYISKIYFRKSYIS